MTPEKEINVPLGRAADLAAMAAYADDSIVSRTLAEEGGGTMTVFAFGAGQKLSEHTAPFDAFVLVLDGEGEFTVGGETIRAAAGQLVYMPADVPHAVGAPERFKMLLIMLRPA